MGTLLLCSNLDAVGDELQEQFATTRHSGVNLHVKSAD